MPVKYSSTETIASDVIPGVTYTLRKMSNTRRASLLLALAESKRKLGEYVKEAIAIESRPKDQQNNDRIAELWDLTQIERANVNAAWIRWGLKSIDGYELDGAPATIETLLEEGQPELVQEIADRTKLLSEMSEEELKNFDWRTTSGSGTGTPANSTTAPAASDKASSEVETVAVITPA